MSISGYGKTDWGKAIVRETPNVRLQHTNSNCEAQALINVPFKSGNFLQVRFAYSDWGYYTAA